MHYIHIYISFGGRAPPGSAGRAHNATPDSLAVLGKGGDGNGRRNGKGKRAGREGGGGKGRERTGREGVGRGKHGIPLQKYWIHH